MEHKVRLFMDDIYQVFELKQYYAEKLVYQGRLADCEAYIRLTEGGYM